MGECSEGMQWILGGAPVQMCDFNKVAFHLWLNLQCSVVVFPDVCCILLEHLSVGLLLDDCFCEKLVIIVSFICVTLRLFMCLTYWGIVPVVIFFYCIKILKQLICYCKNLNMIYKKTFYRLCRYKIKFEKDISRNASF